MNVGDIVLVVGSAKYKVPVCIDPLDVGVIIEKRLPNPNSLWVYFIVLGQNNTTVGPFFSSELIKV